MPPYTTLAPDLVAQGWEQHLDAARNRPYWWNKNTGESRWTPPTAQVPVVTQLVAPVKSQPVVVAVKLREQECKRLGLPTFSTSLPAMLPGGDAGPAAASSTASSEQDSAAAQPLQVSQPWLQYHEASTAAAAAAAAAVAATGAAAAAAVAAAAGGGTKTATTTAGVGKTGAAAAADHPLTDVADQAKTATTATGSVAASAAGETIELLDSSDENTDEKKSQKDIAGSTQSGEQSTLTTSAAATQALPAATIATVAPATGASLQAHTTTRAAMPSSKWPKGGFKIGTQCDALDGKGTWLRAEVIKIGGVSRRGSVRVRYRGYSSKWDEWIPIPASDDGDTARLVAPGTQTSKAHQPRSLHGAQSASSSESDDEQSEGETVDGGSPSRGSRAFAALAAANRGMLVGLRVRELSVQDEEDEPQCGVVDKHNEDDATFNLRFEDGRVKKRVTHVALQKMLLPLEAAEAERHSIAAAAKARELQQQASSRRARRRLLKQQQQQQQHDKKNDEDGPSTLDDLLAAAETGDVTKLQRVMDAGVDANSVKEADGVTALMLAAQGNHQAVLTVLLNLPTAKLNLVDKDGWSALMYAAHANHVASVQALCAARADLEIRESQYGMTAFLIACENGRVDVAKALAESGADINAKDNDGSDAKRLAEIDKHDKVLRLLQTLLQKDDSGQSSSGNTAGRKSTRAERAAKRKREAQNDEDGYL